MEIQGAAVERGSDATVVLDVGGLAALVGIGSAGVEFTIATTVGVVAPSNLKVVIDQLSPCGGSWGWGCGWAWSRCWGCGWGRAGSRARSRAW